MKGNISKIPETQFNGVGIYTTCVNDVGKVRKKNVFKETMKRNNEKEKDNRSIVISEWKRM